VRVHRRNTSITSATKRLFFVTFTLFFISASTSEANGWSCRRGLEHLSRLVFRGKNEAKSVLRTSILTKLHSIFSNPSAYKKLPLPDLTDKLIKDIEPILEKLSLFQLQLLDDALRKTVVNNSAAHFLANTKGGRVDGQKLTLELFRVVLNHPMTAIVGRHELSHLFRLGIRPLRTSVKRIFISERLKAAEEKMAW